MARNLTKHLKELRIHLCQTSSASAGVRDYITTNYVAIKKVNPDFPILIRECSGIQVRHFPIEIEKLHFRMSSRV